MILQDERNRLGFAISGAVIIHALLFVAMQLGVHWPVSPAEPAPIYVELNAPVQQPEPPAAETPAAPAPTASAATTEAAPAAQSAPASTRTAPASTRTAPASTRTAPASTRTASASTRTAPTPREYDPLAQAPSAADLRSFARQSDQTSGQPAQTPGQSSGAGRSSQGNAAAGPTPQENLFAAQQQQRAEQFRAQNPVESGSVAPAALPSSSETSQAAPSTDPLSGKIDRTMQSVTEPRFSPSGSGPSAAAPSNPASASPGISDSRLKFTNGVARSLISADRLNLNQDLVNSILKKHPNHPPVIEVRVTFTAKADGFVSNLNLAKDSGYSELDQVIRNLFERPVFKPAPGSPAAEGEITYRIETDTAR